MHEPSCAFAEGPLSLSAGSADELFGSSGSFAWLVSALEPIGVLIVSIVVLDSRGMFSCQRLARNWKRRSIPAPVERASLARAIVLEPVVFLQHAACEPGRCCIGSEPATRALDPLIDRSRSSPSRDL